jgi:hypothetical protein
MSEYLNNTPIIAHGGNNPLERLAEKLGASPAPIPNRLRLIR